MNEEIKVGSIVYWTGTTFDTGVVLKINKLRGTPYYDIYWFVEKCIVDNLSDQLLQTAVP